MLAGFTDSYSIGAQNGCFSNIAYEDGFFAQDSWRASKKLTLQLGIRYDILTRPYEAKNRQASFDINKSSATYGQVLEAGVNGVSRSIINNSFTDFAPRLGFSYDVRGNGKQVIRGGYGIFYFPDYGGISNQLGQQAPFGGSLSYSAQNGYCVTFTGQTPASGATYGCTAPLQQTTALPAPGYSGFNPAIPPACLRYIPVTRLPCAGEMIQTTAATFPEAFRLLHIMLSELTEGPQKKRRHSIPCKNSLRCGTRLPPYSGAPNRCSLRPTTY